VRLSVTWWRCLTDPVGARQSIAWEALAADLQRAAERPYRGDAQPGWSPATFREDRRAKDGAESVSALCLDYDQGGETADAIAARWGGLLGAVHSTRKHTADAPRFRVILTLSRPVSPFEFAGLWRRVAAVAGAVDVAAKDPSRGGRARRRRSGWQHRRWTRHATLATARTGTSERAPTSPGCRQRSQAAAVTRRRGRSRASWFTASS